MYRSYSYVYLYIAYQTLYFCEVKFIYKNHTRRNFNSGVTETFKTCQIITIFYCAINCTLLNILRILSAVFIYYNANHSDLVANNRNHNCVQELIWSRGLLRIWTRTTLVSFEHFKPFHHIR